MHFSFKVNVTFTLLMNTKLSNTCQYNFSSRQCIYLPIMGGYVCHRVHVHTYVHSGQFRDTNQSNHISLVCGWKLESPEENQDTQRETDLNPPNPGGGKARALTTEPPQTWPISYKFLIINFSKPDHCVAVVNLNFAEVWSKIFKKLTVRGENAGMNVTGTELTQVKGCFTWLLQLFYIALLSYSSSSPRHYLHINQSSLLYGALIAACFGRFAFSSFFQKLT